MSHLAQRQEPIWIGNTVRVEATFVPLVGVALPSVSDVSVTARRPDGTTVAGTVESGDGPGEFWADILADQAGSWFVRAACTGAVASAEEKQFVVTASKVLGA